MLTRAVLLTWRRELQQRGFAEATIANYVKNVNRYLDYVGRQDLRFNKGCGKNLTAQEFGYLTAIEATDRKDRNDIVWRCRCRCGKEVFLPATRLLTANTLSCGCLAAQHLQEVNRYIDHTSLRSALEEKVESNRAASGYTGIAAKREKWQAYINYKGKRYFLGCYTDIEDAKKARARAKEWVQQDAVALLATYEALHKNDPQRPTRNQVRKKPSTHVPEV